MVSKGLTARLALGGAVFGSFFGTFIFALISVVYGGLVGDISFGLDAALLGGALGLVSGGGYGVLVALRDEAEAERDLPAAKDAGRQE